MDMISASNIISAVIGIIAAVLSKILIDLISNRRNNKHLISILTYQIKLFKNSCKQIIAENDAASQTNYRSRTGKINSPKLILPETHPHFHYLPKRILNKIYDIKIELDNSNLDLNIANLEGSYYDGIEFDIEREVSKKLLVMAIDLETSLSKSIMSHIF
ncbi:hypothetical protein G3A39_42125 [Paraburkholderia aspalathi]|nr:hypothetical protein [Paraburkholderia aspalathi]